jgi:murein DD-endopeptidase MepM/ murein hydrolase activator NlpD
MKNKLLKLSKLLLVLLIVLLLVPSNPIIPVANATESDWNKNSYWRYPWGESVTHKGIDIFAPKGTDVVSPIAGVVLAAKQTGNGGNIVRILGAKWRIYYFAHLDTSYVSPGEIIAKGSKIGKVGNTGNAISKSPHLHYAIITLLPYFWLYDRKAPQGHLKTIYLSPLTYGGISK